MSKWNRVGWVWDQLAQDNAYGAILTKDGQVAEWNLRDFLATGREDIERFLPHLNTLSPDGPRRRALDFGCGVGRVTRPLSQYFEHVTGVDASPSMIARARALHADLDRCRFVLNQAPHLRQFADGSFDVVYSRIVLQHLRPWLARRYIGELIRVLAPGGVMMFQLPETMSLDPRDAYELAPVEGNPLKRLVPKPAVIWWRRLKYGLVTRGTRVIEMHMFGLPKDEVLHVIESAGGRVLDTRPDDSHGEEGIRGFEYWVTRSG
jgi:SAM-dependent methyltransferase